MSDSTTVEVGGTEVEISETDDGFEVTEADDDAFRQYLEENYMGLRSEYVCDTNTDDPDGVNFTDGGDDAYVLCRDRYYFNSALVKDLQDDDNVRLLCVSWNEDEARIEQNIEPGPAW